MKAFGLRRMSLPVFAVAVVLYCSLFASQALAGELTAESPSDGLQSQATVRDYTFLIDEYDNPAITVKAVSAGTVSYDSEKETLTLDGVEMEGVYLDGCKSLTINLIGENTGSNVFVYDKTGGQGIEGCNLTVTGTGSAVGRFYCEGDLVIESGDITAVGVDGVGQDDVMWRDGITGNASVTIKGGSVVASAAGHDMEYGGAGICSVGDLTIQGNASVTLTGNNNGSGLTCIRGDLIVRDGASLVVTAKDGSGIRSDALLLDGGSIEVAIQGDEWRAVEADYEIKLEKGTMTTSAEGYVETICCDTLILNGGTLNSTAKNDGKNNGDPAADTAIAVRCLNNLALNGGTFVASSLCPTKSFAIEAERAMVSPSCTVKVYGGINALDFPIEHNGNTYKVTSKGLIVPFMFIIPAGITLVKHGSGAAMPKGHEIAICGYSYPIVDLADRASISEAKIAVASVTYTGKAVEPKATVTHAGQTLVKDVDYTVTYKTNVKVGTAKAIVTGIDRFKGKKTVTFKINPKGTSLKGVTPASKALTVKWAKRATKMSASRIIGYEVQVATNSKFTKNVKTAVASGYSKTSKRVGGLKGGKKYFARVRTYKTVSGAKYYSPWSKAKYATTLK